MGVIYTYRVIKMKEEINAKSSLYTKKKSIYTLQNNKKVDIFDMFQPLPHNFIDLFKTCAKTVS